MLIILKSVLLSMSVLIFLACSSSSSEENSNTIDLDEYKTSELNSTQKYALAYMWNEEKLAHDLYLDLYDLFFVETFSNIANRSESKHIMLVEDLIQKYDINITNLQDYTIKYSQEELRRLERGVFAVDEIQDLYNTLYTIGDDSLVDALKVGCMVEVTDVDDLDKYIINAAEAKDLVDTFKILRLGSYNHYWAFDNALKKQGISQGCCSIGVIEQTNYCKTSADYPVN